MFKKVGGLLGAALISLSALGSAEATGFTGAPVGSTVTAVNTTALSSGSFAQCTGHTWNGPVTVDNGPGAGGSIAIQASVFSGCTYLGSPMVVAPVGLPWTLTLNGSGGGTLTYGYQRAFPGVSCNFVGTVGATFNNATGILAVSGSVTRVSGGFPCAASETVSVSWRLRGVTGANLAL
ncbi:MAG TPA: hypothetical protein VN238_22905 [Solirubrobacteraceae bacterium]|nr:hypothetical protein [Solirubrobacteraceae bacterium]